MKTALAMQWRLFKVALMFFTRLPVRIADFHESDLHHAARYFPLVGIVVGFLSVAAFGVTILFWPLELAVLASMGVTIWVTGAFHEDGLADAADGLGGGWDKERVLAIMQDSRLGSFGAIALFMALLVKFEALIHIEAPLLPAILVAGHAVSRFAAVLVIFTQSYVRTEGKSKPLATHMSRHEAMLAALFGLLPLGLLVPKLWLAVIPVMLVWWWFSRLLQRRLGGYTGDCLGAMQQMSEIAFYLGVLLWSSI
jgi:adenosylcobinamide-GDP ribazoletransferase